MTEKDPINQEDSARDRAQSKIQDPTPGRRKYVIDLLYQYLSDQISLAQLTGIPQKDLYALAEVGHVKLRHGRIREAQQIFTCLTNVDKKNPFFHSALGCAYQKMRKYVEAVLEYSRAIDLKRDDFPSVVNRGEIYLIKKNYKKAAEDFRAAILLDPNGKNLHANRARSLVIAIKRNLQLDREALQAKNSEKPKQMTKAPSLPKLPV